MTIPRQLLQVPDAFFNPWRQPGPVIVAAAEVRA